MDIGFNYYLHNYVARQFDVIEYDRLERIPNLAILFPLPFNVLVSSNELHLIVINSINR